MNRLFGTFVLLTFAAATAPAHASSARILYSFTGGADGGTPMASLIADAAGNLFTATYGGGSAGRGTVARLSPPAAGRSCWSFSLLHCFCSEYDGANPLAALIADSAGNLYTTTFYGGKEGTGAIVKLSPYATSQTPWREAVLHSFSAGTGPTASLIADAAGNFYTTTSYGETTNNGTIAEFTQ
jgi:hypothetical protein